MGLGDYFRRRRAKESALPEGMETAPPSASDAGSPPGGFAPLPGDSVHGAPTQAPAGGGMVQQMMALQQLMATHEVNLRSQPMEVRQQVVAEFQAAGIPAQVGGELNITDPQQIQSVVQILKNHGLLPQNVQVN